jgi:LVIVD repeat
MTPSRRTVLKYLGTGTATLASVSSASAKGWNQASKTDTMRLFSEVDVDGAQEVVTQNTWAYVATGDGFAVIDWRNPNRPEKVVDMHAPGVGIADVKVENDILAVCSQGSEEHDHDGDGGNTVPDSEIGTHFYDVTDPTDPQYQGTFQVLPAGVHNAHLVDDVAYICKEAPFDDSALLIVDISDPTAPTLLSEWRVEDAHPELDSPTNFVHDVYAQDGYAYLAYWDAGTRILDVNDPTNPVEVSAFGEAPGADQGSSGNVNDRIYGPPGNAHYVQPSPDGDHVYVGAETYIVESGGIKVFDVTDFDAPEQVAEVEPPDVDEGIFGKTSHNFDVTANRLYTSWYDGGAAVFDITDPSTPEQRYRYDPEGTSFWTAVRARGFVVVSDIGSGIRFLKPDHGQ